MAEFVDVVVGHQPDEPPWIAFEDDLGNGVRITRVEANHDEWGNYVERYRIQHDEIESL